MKTVEELKPNFAPVYAGALYPEMASIFHKHGYALAIHGSLARDFDVIAVKWVENVSPHKDVLDEITKTFAIQIIGEPVIKNHNRIAYTISVGFGHCTIDLSFI